MDRSTEWHRSGGITYLSLAGATLRRQGVRSLHDRAVRQIKRYVQAMRLVDQIVDHCRTLWARARFRTHMRAIIASRWNARMSLDI